MAVDGRIATSRYHGLDFVRALMMSLGVVLHTALVFMPEGWIYMDPDSVAWSPLIVWTIHIFRMSAFFVMAGFFGAMLHARRGTATFLGHRFDRIVVPLVIGWFVLSPLMSLSLSFARPPPSPHTSLIPRFASSDAQNVFFRITSCGTCWRFGNVGLRSIVIAHGKEDAFHIPLNVILRFSARNSVFTRYMVLETPYKVRSRPKLLVHLPNCRARQCVTSIQHIDISVDGENDVPDVKLQTKTII